MSSCEPALYISSNDLDYSIVLKRYRRYSKELVDRILPHMSRMRHLCIPWTHLHDDDGNVSQLLSTLIDAPGPQLETFNLYRGRADGRCFALPAIFGGHTPRLSILKLCYSFPRMGSVSFTNLKELYIRGRKRDLITMELSQIMEIPGTRARIFRHSQGALRAESGPRRRRSSGTASTPRQPSTFRHGPVVQRLSLRTSSAGSSSPIASFV